MTHRKRWKAVTTDYTALQSYDNIDDINICLTQREVAILKALLIPAYWTTRWENLTIDADELNEIVALIDAKLDSGCVPPVTGITDIRQVDCILEYELDSVWVPFANLSDCASDGGTDYITQVELNINIALTYQSIYIAGDQRSINIFAPLIIFNGDDAGIPTADRETALCMAAQAYVGGYAARKVQELDAHFLGQFFLLNALSVLTGGIGILAGMFLDSQALVGGHSYADSRAALMNPLALKKAACCMYEGLRGETVDQLAFQLSLGACAFTPGSDEEIVREYLVSSFPALQSYLSFIDATGRAFTQVSIFGVDACICDFWCHVFDFTVSDGGFYIDPSFNRGVYVPGVGWQTNYVPNSYSMVVRKDFVSTSIISMEYTYTLTGLGGSDVNALLYWDGTWKVYGVTELPVIGVDQLFEQVVDKTTTAIAMNPNGANNVTSTITRIEIRGTGTNPFGADNC